MIRTPGSFAAARGLTKALGGNVVFVSGRLAALDCLAPTTVLLLRNFPQIVAQCESCSRSSRLGDVLQPTKRHIPSQVFIWIVIVTIVRGIWNTGCTCMLIEEEPEDPA